MAHTEMDGVLASVDKLAVSLGVGFEWDSQPGLRFTWEQIEILEQFRSACRAEAAEEIREQVARGYTGPAADLLDPEKETDDDGA